MWEKEKMLVTSIFSFSHIVFYPLPPKKKKKKFLFISYICFVVFKNAFSVNQSKSLLLGKELKICINSQPNDTVF